MKSPEKKRSGGERNRGVDGRRKKGGGGGRKVNE